MRSPSPHSPSPNSPSTQDALLHGQFTGWSMGGGSGGSSGGSSSGADSGPSSPAGSVSLPSSPSSCTYALTLTLTHIHVQRVCPRPGKEARVLLPLSELVGCNCPRSPAALLVLYWYPMGRRRKGVAKRRQVRAYLAESRAEAEKWNTAVQCLLRGIDVSVYTGRCVRVSVGVCVHKLDHKFHTLCYYAHRFLHLFQNSAKVCCPAHVACCYWSIHTAGGVWQCSGVKRTYYL